MEKTLEKIILESQNLITRDFREKFYTLGLINNSIIDPIKFNNQYYLIARTFFNIKDIVLQINKSSFFYIEFEGEFNNCVLYDNNVKNKLHTNSINEINTNDLSSMGVTKLYDDMFIYYFTKEPLKLNNERYTFVENGVVKKQFHKNELNKNIKEIYG